MLSAPPPCGAGIHGGASVEFSLPWRPGITIGGGDAIVPCCAKAGATPPISIAIARRAAVSAEIKLRFIPGFVFVAVIGPAFRLSGAHVCIMILFAPALGKPFSFADR